MTTLLDRATARLARLPIFSPADYAVLNPDLVQSGADIARHALLHGCAERRQVFKRDRVARAWGEALLRTSRAAAASDASVASLLPSVTVFVSSWSSPAIHELAQWVARDLRAQGSATAVETERALLDAAPNAAIVVAPQEFFRLGFGPAWRSTALARSALMLNTTTPGSDEFTSAVPYLLAGRGTLDLSPQVVDIFAQADMPAVQVRPTIPFRERWLKPEDAEHPLVLALPEEARQLQVAMADLRPIDVSFIGGETAWRGVCLTRIAPELMTYRTFFQTPSSAADPIERGVLDRAQFRVAGHVAARSRLVLQLNGSEVPSLDWLATFQAMAAGAVVVTDRATPHPEFTAGVHLFADDSRHLPDLIAWLLDDADGRAAAEAARSTCQAVLRDASGPQAWTRRAAALWSTG